MHRYNKQGSNISLWKHSFNQECRWFKGTLFVAERFDPINEENNYSSVSLCFVCCNIYSFLVVVGGAKALKCAFMDAIVACLMSTLHLATTFAPVCLIQTSHQNDALDVFFMQNKRIALCEKHSL